MATYKVIQDIEAEDKLIGPFGIRQFIYLIIVAVSLFVGFQLAMVAWFLVLPLLPHTLFFALLALPFGGQQPTETWLLAKIRFAIKPRVRIWDQSGIKDLVTITVPKKIEKILVKDMSQHEVRSRLEALANTIDSRGWAVKNVNVNMFSQPSYAGTNGADDRLLDINSMGNQSVMDDVSGANDMLDDRSNPNIQNIDRMINASSKAHHDQAISQMKQYAAAPDPQSLPAPTRLTTGQKASQATNSQSDYWFLDKKGGSNGAARGHTPSAVSPAPLQGNSNVVLPDPAAVQAQDNGLPLQPVGQHPAGPLTEEELLDKIHNEKANAPKSYGNMRVIKTLDDQQSGAQAKESEETQELASKTTMTPAPNPDIIELARNDDLNVETVARQANRKPKDDSANGEVVINLH